MKNILTSAMEHLVKLNIDGFHAIKEEINSKIAFNEGYVDKMCLELNFPMILCIVCLFAWNFIYKKNHTLCTNYSTMIQI